MPAKSSTNTSLALNNRTRYILIGLASVFALVSISVGIYAIVRYTQTPSSPVDDKPKPSRPDRSAQDFPSPKMKKWLDQLKIKDPKLADQPYYQILVSGMFDPEAHDFRSKCLLNMDKERDFPYLAFVFAQQVPFNLSDDEVSETWDHNSYVKKKKLEIKQGQPPANQGKSMRSKPYATLYNPEQDKTRSKIEIAGMAKGGDKIISYRHMFTKDGTVAQFGDDCAGVSPDGRILVVADGVSTAAESILTAKAIVHLVIEMFDQFPEARLETHYWRLLETIVRFIRLFKLDGKATLTIAQIDYSAQGGDLTVLNVGDSGCGVIHNDRMIMMTPIGQHSPNQPYQLPSSIQTDLSNAGLYQLKKLPKNSYVILYSDGISDNLWPRAIAMKHKEMTGIVASYVAAMAAHVYLKGDNSEVPATVHMGKPVCGKADDVTAVVVCMS